MLKKASAVFSNDNYCLHYVYYGKLLLMKVPKWKTVSFCGVEKFCETEYGKPEDTIITSFHKIIPLKSNSLSYLFQVYSYNYYLKNVSPNAANSV